MDVDPRKAASNAVTRPVAIVIGPKEPTQEAMDRILTECCYAPLERLGPCGGQRLQAYNGHGMLGNKANAPAHVCISSTSDMMVLLTHICGDMPAMTRMLGRRGHRCKRFCHRCQRRDYDDLTGDAEAAHQTHEQYVQKATEVYALQHAWNTASRGASTAAKRRLDDARAEHGINMYSSMFSYLGYVDIMTTAHTALMHCVLYGVLKGTLEVAFEPHLSPEANRGFFLMSSTRQMNSSYD